MESIRLWCCNGSTCARIEHTELICWQGRFELDALLLFLLRVSNIKLSLLRFVSMMRYKVRHWSNASCISDACDRWIILTMVIYICVCLYIYDSKLHNGECHFLWIIDALELSHTKEDNRSICSVLLLRILFFKVALGDVFIANGVHVLIRSQKPY